MEVLISKFATWYRTLYNGYEPFNVIKLKGELSADGETYVIFEMWGSLTFNDGHSFVSIDRRENGQFRWRKGDEIGITASFMDAWDKMPAYVTDPDDYEESPMIITTEAIMNIPKNQIIYVTLRASDGSDIVTNKPVRFSGEAYHFLTLKSLGFKKIWNSDTTAVYSQVSYADLSLIAVTNDE